MKTNQSKPKLSSTRFRICMWAIIFIVVLMLSILIIKSDEISGAFRPGTVKHVFDMREVKTFTQREEVNHDN